MKPYQDRYTTRVKTAHERRIKLVDQCDDKVKAQFKNAGDGKELSLADMEANLAKLDEYEALGLLTPKAGGDGNTVVVPAAGQQHVTTKADNSPRTFDPWKS
ncbi:MAG: hypothetical protein NTV22_11330 [bacterium]|nr:hypothetical protein [bacterium]